MITDNGKTRVKRLIDRIVQNFPENFQETYNEKIIRASQYWEMRDMIMDRH